MKNHAAHSRVTAICVNLALDAVEADIRSVLDLADPKTAQMLEDLLARLKGHRVAEASSPNVPFLM